MLEVFMKKSPLQILIGILALVLFGFATAKGYDTYQVSSAKVLNSENWGLCFSEDGQPPTANNTSEELKKYNSYYIGDTSQKKIYLTFDCGYENGYTATILDTLKDKKVSATFFLVGNYLESEPELVKRMKAEGHTIGNHTFHHKDMSSLTEEEFSLELESFEETLKQITGQESDKFYRPPQGKYSIKNLENAKKAGYKTCFWSLAYVDWYDDNQPSKEEAFDKLLGRIHNGAIVLLHSTSKTNCEILPELIDQWRAMGYEIHSLATIQ